MTGKHYGCILSLKILLGRSVKWVVCLPHLNELSLRHVFQTLDGVTISSDSFLGVIRRKLNWTVSDWKVIKFKLIF